MSIARTLYSLLTWAAQPLLKRKLRRRAQAEPGYAQAVPERFGYYSPRHAGARWGGAMGVDTRRLPRGKPGPQPCSSTPCANLPQLRLLLTHSTATGRAEGQKLLLPDDVQVGCPGTPRQRCSAFCSNSSPWWAC